MLLKFLPFGLSRVPLLGDLIPPVAAVVALIFLARVIERRPLSEVGLRTRGMARDTFLGFLIGTGAFVAVIATMAAAGWYRAVGWYRAAGTAWHEPGVGRMLGIYLFHFLLVAVLAIGIHWAWNFVEGPIFGTAVSGGSGKGLIKPVITGPDLWTGGAFGPEAGLVALIIGTAVGIILLWLAARRGQMIAPPWRRSG